MSRISRTRHRDQPQRLRWSYNGPIPDGGVALGERVQIIPEIEAERLSPGVIRNLTLIDL